MTAGCVHHWLVDSNAAVPLRGRQAAKYPGCIGRRSICRKCGTERVLPERIAFTDKAMDEEDEDGLH